MGTERLTAYYALPGFLSWVTKNRFELITPDNVATYYSLFQKNNQCANKDCVNCEGWFYTFKSEEDILTGKMILNKCVVYEQTSKKQKAESLLYKLRVPSLYNAYTWESFENRLSLEPLKSIQEYSKNFPNNNPLGLYVYAKERIGKTALLWVLVKDLLSNLKTHKGVVIKSMPIFISELREGEFSTSGENFPFEESLNCDLLILDDFGREKQTEWTFQKIFAILEHRCVNELPVIISSSYSSDPNLWTGPYESALISRINEVTHTVSLTGTE